MKNSQKFKYLVLGMIIMGVFSTMFGPTMAAMFQKQITVSTGVNIYVDDVKVNSVDASGKSVEPFIYNGTTYLPVRAVSYAVGKAISWDSKTKSVYLGKHDSSVPVVMLSSLDYFDKKGEKFKYIDDVKDNLGNIYNKGVYSNYGYNTNWQTYYINGMYSKMKGKYILGYNHRDSKDENRFKVYGDGNLIYNSSNMSGGVHPIDFDIDLTGVLELKIEFTRPNQTVLVDTGLYQ